MSMWPRSRTTVSISRLTPPVSATLATTARLLLPSCAASRAVVSEVAGVDIVDHNVRTLARVSERNITPNAPTGARDNSNLIL